MNLKVKKYLKISLIAVGVMAVGFGAYSGSCYLYENKTDLEHQYNKYTGLNKFRGLELGSDLEINDNLIFVENYTPKEVGLKVDSTILISRYIKNGENLKVGDLKVDSIYYDYFNKKLLRVLIKGDSSCLGLIEVYQNLYGNPYKNVKDQFYYKCGWENSTSLINFVYYLEFFTEISIISKPVREEIFAADRNLKQDRLNKRAKDL